MSAPPDDAPQSRNPRAPREKFNSIPEAAELARRDALEALRSLPPPKRELALPRWGKWVALGALAASVIRWLLG